MISKEIESPEFKISAECILDIVKAIRDIMNTKYHPLAYIGRRRVTSEYKKIQDIGKLYSTLWRFVMEVSDDIEFEEQDSGNIFNIANAIRGERIA